jgi:hypothetical protein
MARKIYVLGIFTMAAACGVIGYQLLTYYFYGDWPAVSFEFVVGRAFGGFPVLAWPWANRLLGTIGQLPVSVIGFAASYFLLLLSDLLRGNARQRA